MLRCLTTRTADQKIFTVKNFLPVAAKIKRVKFFTRAFNFLPLGHAVKIKRVNISYAKILSSDGIVEV